ncbi:hypothetical protein E3E35_01165 [Thermococcus sp. GR7]|nr:hypothetical protein [Thermococcus sp. GR7]NJE79351.1 hypothetical protein [Thermococcus sp. GR4]NJF22236.1 hypothetical protein [Thermococcus sp. GR5]
MGLLTNICWRISKTIGVSLSFSINFLRPQDNHHCLILLIRKVYIQVCISIHMVIIMGEKVRTTVLISRELHQKAKDKGINLSRLLEKALMIELELLESLDLKREEFLRQGLLEDKVKSGDEKLGGGMMSLEPPDW